ncbi:hypothetical protein [Sphingobium fuliginis]|uniref:Uncharacterized protein n=1 Tax=Sphingobium fuliginis ATCC 27551 TaxID=1208342 RepID=A0A5B8CEC4_SPHSA|nr:hypothetical protein [Sphingobium fuliginis]QDC37225.1 hypothetical protein FIL70_08335 [Sphingobium fuliginis ATCC 27551]
MKHRIRVVQIFRVVRSIETDVEAATPDQALDLIDEGLADVPAFDDPGWSETRTLEHETIVGRCIPIPRLVWRGIFLLSFAQYPAVHGPPQGRRPLQFCCAKSAPPSPLTRPLRGP